MNAPNEAFAAVGRAVRVARVAEQQPDFWKQYRCDLAGNHEALYLTAWCVLRAIDLEVPPSTGMVERLRAALAAKDALDASLSAHVNHGVQEAA